MRVSIHEKIMSTDWPFHPNYRVDLPPTQIREAQKRCMKKNIVDMQSENEETLAVITQVHLAYSKKKERARAASTKARAAKSAEASALDIEVEPTEEAACVVCEVVAEAEQAPEPEAAPEPAAAAPKAAKTRADNVAPEAVPKKPVEAPAPAPAPKRAAAAEAPAPRRRGGGLVGMVASIALP